MSGTITRPPQALLLAFMAFICLATTQPPAHADVGVGVSLGNMKVEDALTPGGHYRLPTLSVLNTGSDPAQFEVVVSFAADQRERRPPEEWFAFAPQRFPLEPSTSQAVAISLDLPANAGPGDYFAFLEAHPIAERQGVSIGVAAATKLSFSIRPANVLQAWLFRLSQLIDESQPWSSVFAVTVLAVLAVRLIARYLRVGLRIERRR